MQCCFGETDELVIWFRLRPRLVSLSRRCAKIEK